MLKPSGGVDGTIRAAPYAAARRFLVAGPFGSEATAPAQAAGTPSTGVRRFLPLTGVVAAPTAPRGVWGEAVMSPAVRRA
mmetsp:Transcript_14661/g.43834  ORF Transcript_14661/g.43834 Transcript_14661/m.43834 type:complete len:80 (-) Transcript_14661:322-561(-)